MNTFLNLKTAEKTFQFGVKKCKAMVIGDNIENILNTKLTVDDWEVQHEEDTITGEIKIKETHTGQVEIEKCTEQKYLGFKISSSGNNMINM